MVHVGNRVLVFRLGGIGFILDLRSVVEVQGSESAQLDASRGDIDQGIVAAMVFRGAWLPVVDPAAKLGISAAVRMKDQVAVVLSGPEGSWAILVDAVDELSAEDSFVSCEIPFLLKASTSSGYSQLKLRNAEPFVVFDPELFYGSPAMRA